jgi:Ca-activated chloride channel family protein
MRFIWPQALILLAIIPLVLLAYALVMRRRRKYALRFSSLTLVRSTVGPGSRFRRYFPLVLFLMALASLVLAVGRPVTVAYLPTDETTIILALDVSLSMRAIDIEPSRMDAAKRAALQFVQDQNPGTKIGIVAFSGFAELIQPPTADRGELETAIMSLTFGRRTAIGSGLLRSLEAIAEIDENVAPLTLDESRQFQPVAPGAYAPAIVVLLTDGVSNAGIEPLDAAQMATDRGIRVYTIGFGTDKPIMPAGGLFPGSPPLTGDIPGARFRLAIDEDTLKEVAEMTGGEYYVAMSAGELQKVFNNLPTQLIARSEVNEIGVFFVLGGGLLVALAIALSLAWRPLP